MLALRAETARRRARLARGARADDDGDVGEDGRSGGVSCEAVQLGVCEYWQTAYERLDFEATRKKPLGRRILGRLFPAAFQGGLL